MVIHTKDQGQAWMEHLQKARAHLHQLSDLSREEDFAQHLHAAAALELLSGQFGLANENLRRWRERQSVL